MEKTGSDDVSVNTLNIKGRNDTNFSQIQNRKGGRTSQHFNEANITLMRKTESCISINAKILNKILAV